MLNSWQPMHGARDAQYRPSLLDRSGMFDTFFQHACPPPPSSARCLDQPDVSLDRTSARSAPTGCLTRMQAAGAQGGRSTKETHACVSVCVRMRARARGCVCTCAGVRVSTGTGRGQVCPPGRERHSWQCPRWRPWKVRRDRSSADQGATWALKGSHLRP